MRSVKVAAPRSRYSMVCENFGPSPALSAVACAATAAVRSSMPRVDPDSTMLMALS